ncbi:MAG: SpoIIE family protein phosphatase [Acidimicrobiia bacterium]
MVRSSGTTRSPASTASSPTTSTAPWRPSSRTQHVNEAVRIHPEDLPSVTAEIQEALERGGAFHTEFRVVRPDGSTAWIQGRGRAVHDAAGVPVRMLGIGSDTTQLRTTREQLGRTLEHISDGVVLLDTSWTIVYVNARAARLLKRSVDELVGRSIRDEFRPAVGTEFGRVFREVVRSQESRAFETHYGPLDGWFEVRLFPTPTGLTVYFQDVNERRAREAQQEQLVAQLEAALRRQAETQAVVTALAEALSVEEVAEVVLEQARRALGTVYAGVALLDEDGESLRFVTLDPLPLETVRQWGTVPMALPSAMTDAVRERRAVYHACKEDLLADYPQLGAFAGTLPAEAYASIPLVSGRTVIGALSMSWAQERTVSEEDRAFVRTLAAQCAQAIERAQLFSRQASVADTLQRAMLPDDLPFVEGLDISACYLAATTDLTIGGDWYDAFELRDGRIAIAVGDVSGHGLPAAAVMGRIRNSLRAYVLDDQGPAVTLAKLDAVVDLDGQGLFATAVVGIYDPATGELVFASAGHPPLLVVSGDGTARYVEGHIGAPVGVRGPQGHLDGRVTIEPGDLLIAFTDGLVERRDEHLDVGLARLATTAVDPELDLVAAGCEALVHHVMDGAAREDDICVLMLHRRV